MEPPRLRIADNEQCWTRPTVTIPKDLKHQRKMIIDQKFSNGFSNPSVTRSTGRSGFDEFASMRSTDGRAPMQAQFFFHRGKNNGGEIT
jgi:hypothetical protein